MSLRAVSLVFCLAALGLAGSFHQDGAPARASAVPCDVYASPGNAQQKIDRAGPNTVICLEPGVYGRLLVNQKSNLLVFGAGQRQTVVTDGTQDHTCLLVLESQNIWLHNMSAYGCKVQGAYVGGSTDVLLSYIETALGPIGFQFQGSTGTIVSSRAHGHGAASATGFGALIQQNSDVKIGSSWFDNNAGFGILSQGNATLDVSETWVVSNRDGGVFTIRDSGRTTIRRSAIALNGLNVFAGVPGCAPLPPADASPPSCYLQNPGAYYSDIVVNMSYSVVHGSPGTGVVFFPGVQATLRRNTIQHNNVTGLFGWGAHVNSRHDRYTGNRENGVECRAYPAPSTGDRGRCEFTYTWIDRSRPLPGNVLGGGFVSEGARVYLRDSDVEYNWGVGITALHNSVGEISNNTVRGNGGSGLCISGSPNVAHFGNTYIGNRPGNCLPHP